MINSQAPQYILLIADDHLADTLSTALTDEGYHVICTSTAELAWEMHQHYHPAVTVIDTALRHIDPIALCQRIRVEVNNDHNAILCLIQPRQQDRIDKLLAAGADDCLFTPVNTRLLRQRVRLMLRTHRTLTGLHHRILDWLIDPAFICDRAGKITAINQQLMDLTGYRPDDLIHVNGFDLLINDDYDWLTELQQLNENQRVQRELRLRRKNMALVPVMLDTKLVDTDSCLVTLRDITDQMQTQLDLQESEHNYRDLFNSANDAILIVDITTGRFLNANRLAARWLGYSQEELLTLSFDAIDVPMDDEQHEQVRKELSTNGRLIYEQYYRTSEGKLIPVEVSSRLIRYEGRRAFLCFARDITRRREIEAAERSQRVLAEALSATAAALNSSLNFDQIIRKMLDLIANVVPSEAANVMRIQGKDVVIVGHRGYDRLGLADEWDTLRIELDRMASLKVMQQNWQPVCIPDTQGHPGWSQNRGVHEWIRSYVGAPIVVEGTVIGFLNLDSATPDQFNEQHAETLMLFANQAGIALHNAQLFERIQLHADELERRVEQRTAELSSANLGLQEQIAERQRAEIALAEERNLLRTLIDSLPDDVYVKDREGHFLLMNQNVRQRMERRLPGKSPIGTTDYDHMSAAEADAFKAHEERMYATGEPILNQETMRIDSDGNQRWLLTTKVPLRDQNNNIIGLVGINRDITALRGAEEQLAYVVTGANCLLWDAIVEHEENDDLVWEMRISSETAARRFLPLPEEWNDSYVRALEKSILPEDSQQRNETSRVAILKNYNGYSHEYRCRRADGQIRWLYEEVQIRPVSGNRWSLVGVCTDVTERKQAAQALQDAYDQLEQRVQERTGELSQANAVLKEQVAERRRAEKALRESEARFRALVEHAPEAIVVFDVVTERYINVNENAVQLFGRPRNDLLLHGPTDFSPKYQSNGVESVQLMRQKIREAVNGEPPVFEWVYQDIEGREIPCEVRLLLLPTSGSVLIRGSITDISERLRAQAALRESEEKYRSFTNQLPIGAYRTSSDGRLLFGNPALANILGYKSVEEMMGISMLQFYTTPQIRDRVFEDYTANPGDPVQTENPLIRPDGRVIWVRDTGRAILNEAGEIDYIDGTVEDITERILIQQAELEQRMFAEALRDAAADLNRTLELDEVLDRMLKYITRVMPAHESASIMMIEDDQEHVRVLRYRNLSPDHQALPRVPMRFADVPNWLRMYTTAQPITIPDTRNTSPWGDYFQSSVSIKSYIGAPILAEGKVIGFVNLGSSASGVFNENHSRRLMSFANQVGIAIQNAHLYEEVRRHAQDLQIRVAERTAELETERTRLRAILDAMTEGVTYHDQDGRVLYINRSLARLVGYGESELQQPNMIYSLYSTAEETSDVLQGEIQTGINKAGIWRGLVKVRRRDGSEFDGSLVTTRVDKTEGVSIGAVTVLRDVSQETRLEQQKKRFIAVASHELRTPLTNLKTRLYLIRRQPERIHEHLDVIEAVTDRMRKLVEDLFDISRFEHGMIPLKPEIVALQPLIQDVVSVQQPEAERKEITLECFCPDDLIYAMVDTARFAQVMTNLITNAINYTSAGGSVTVEAAVQEEEIVISVMDTGMGIPEEWFEQIFKPFFRGQEHTTGAGLGLSITREIVELHGGYIDVESTVGKGTCFRVWLRRA